MSDVGWIEIRHARLGTDRVAAVFFGDYVAVNRTMVDGIPSDEQGWSVTHVPTGLVLRRFAIFARAKAFARWVIRAERRPEMIDITAWRSDVSAEVSAAPTEKFKSEMRRDWTDFKTWGNVGTSVSEYRRG